MKFEFYGCNLNVTQMIKMSPPTIYTLNQPIIKRERNENLDKTFKERLFHLTVIHIVYALNNFILLVLLWLVYFERQII